MSGQGTLNSHAEVTHEFRFQLFPSCFILRYSQDWCAEDISDGALISPLNFSN